MLLMCPGMEPGTDEGPGTTLSRSFSAFKRSTSSCGEGRGYRAEPVAMDPDQEPSSSLSTPSTRKTDPGLVRQGSQPTPSPVPWSH